MGHFVIQCKSAPLLYAKVYSITSQTRQTLGRKASTTYVWRHFRAYQPGNDLNHSHTASRASQHCAAVQQPSYSCIQGFAELKFAAFVLLMTSLIRRINSWREAIEYCQDNIMIFLQCLKIHSDSLFIGIFDWAKFFGSLCMILFVEAATKAIHTLLSAKLLFHRSS